MTSQLFVNAKVFTGRGEDDFVSAFRITDGVFSCVGDQADVSGEPAIDLQGRTVVPGFLDVHTHPAFLSTLVDAVMCFPPAVNSLAELLETLRTHPNAGQGADAWIHGFRPGRVTCLQISSTSSRLQLCRSPSRSETSRTRPAKNWPPARR